MWAGPANHFQKTLKCVIRHQPVQMSICALEAMLKKASRQFYETSVNVNHCMHRLLSYSLAAAFG